ncbi:hypothetical protein AYO20_08752 [Fonsecaea nubica]|uniref:Uncharacterized protein n=1 Tax=Fonsecaea nubica TaxID=856822 RepID=A0A178CN38_9EURO|nr:hypothetical protein AYO20_08752 [Fonsecaea nubica]OAL30533.1 hypothetical protein AYO20_08752 [Fonsecaea nubica]
MATVQGAPFLDPYEVVLTSRPEDGCFPPLSSTRRPWIQNGVPLASERPGYNLLFRILQPPAAVSPRSVHCYFMTDEGRTPCAFTPTTMGRHHVWQELTFQGRRADPAMCRWHRRRPELETSLLVQLAIADGAIFGYDTLADLRQQAIPAGEDEMILRLKDAALDQPILRKCTRTGGVTTDPMPKSAFLAIFKSTVINAGYFWSLSIHAIRRMLGNGADLKPPAHSAFPETPCSSYTISTRQTFLPSTLILHVRATHRCRTLTALDASRSFALPAGNTTRIRLRVGLLKITLRVKIPEGHRRTKGAKRRSKCPKGKKAVITPKQQSGRGRKKSLH